MQMLTLLRDHPHSSRPSTLFLSLPSLLFFFLPAAAAAAAAAAVAGDDTHLSRTLNAENPPNHQTPRGGPGTPPPPPPPLQFGTARITTAGPRERRACLRWRVFRYGRSAGDGRGGAARALKIPES
ncbi:hypothetical protein NL676_039731 [Syzygium grande]|nr:hypothetical protein NL676_039731 [Syzygium grande]